MRYKYKAKPITQQSDVEIRLSCVNFRCLVSPFGDEAPEVTDVLVLSKRRNAFVKPSDKLEAEMDEAGCFERVAEDAQTYWAGDCQDYFDGLGECLRDRKMDSFGDMFIAAHKGTP